MTAPAAATAIVTQSSGSAPAETADGATSGDQSADATTEDSSDSEERTDLNALLERRQPPATKKKKEKAEAEAAEPEQEATEEAPEPEAEAKPADPNEVTTDTLFADEALGTPEGVKRARDVIMAAKADLEKRHRRFDRADIKLKKREQATEQRERQVVQREQGVQRIQKLGQAFMEKMDIIRGARVSSPATIMAMLDELAGGTGDVAAGNRLAEDMLIAIHADGKAPEPTRAEKELRAQVEQIRRQREADMAAAQAERLALEENHLRGSITQAQRTIGVTALNAAAYPSISAAVADGEAGITPDSVVEYVTDMMEAHYEEHGAPLDMREAIGILEKKLARFYGQRAPQGENGSGQPNRSRNGAQRRAAPTVLPANADQSSGRGRPLTHEERLDELARDPEFFSELGPAFRNHVGM
jgi:hypothetical protein